MPTITFDYKTLKDNLGKKMTDDELKYKISMLGTSLEEFSKKDITVEVFPNRPDLLGEFGFIRALRTFIGTDKGLKKYNVKPSGKKVIIKASVKKVRPCTVCAIVKNLNLDGEKIRQIIQLQEKLHVTFCRNRKRAAIGIYPSEKITYPITYFAEEPKKIKFMPLGESRQMDGLQILSRHKAGRDYAYLLEGKEIFPFFMDAKNNIMSMPPIINSEMTGKVTEKTREVFIECSGFDLIILSQLLNIIVCELSDMGGEIESMELQYTDKTITTPNLKPTVMKLDEKYAEKILGQKTKIKQCLEMMGFGYENNKVLVPAFRTDILHQMDLVEEIAIAHGYDNFSPELPNISTTGNGNPMETVREKVSEVLIGLGFYGIATLHVSSDEIHVQKMRQIKPLIQIENSKSKEYSALRRSLIPSIMESFARNAQNEYPQKVFDIGTGFNVDKKSETGIGEDIMLCAGIAGLDQDFTKAKQILEYLMSSFGIEFNLKETDNNSFIPGRCGEIIAGGKVIGIIGDIHPEALKNFSLEVPITVFEVSLAKLMENGILPSS
jgi:phenylalanyl-tRNA synthetase beta chain